MWPTSSFDVAQQNLKGLKRQNRETDDRKMSRQERLMAVSRTLEDKYMLDSKGGCLLCSEVVSVHYCSVLQMQI